MRSVERVILLINMIRGFYNIGNLANLRMANIIPNIVKLLENMETEDEAILLGDCHDLDDREFETFLPHCIEGTKETKIIDELSISFIQTRGTYIPKTTFSSFYGTDLEEKLLMWNPEQIIIAGVCADICVLSAAIDLKVRGYEVIVPKYYIETYDAPNHPAEKYNEMAIAIMKTVGVEIVDRI